ncbi:MAG: gamma-glutamyltransferase family protein [Gammaproteobacteria bacterium]|nr:gamma-glutamyltransferase family protein [Gammaproteobacteria bacterium]MDH3469308.1 gamma-glutamyltransferase family protein [Gammaproteobacteria bacterium]
MSFCWELPYPSQRAPVCAHNIVAASQPLAAQAGIGMLVRGGNAVDAAIASAIALTVVEPNMNGIGSDAFAIVWDGAQLHGLNASGRSPKHLQVHGLLARPEMPDYGWPTVTVPGAVSAWVALSERFGKLPFDALFEPAIRYAFDGFIVSPVVAARWSEAVSIYQDYPDFAAAFLPLGRAPKAGELFRSADHAATLSAIAASKGEAFYRGELGARIAAHARDNGAALDSGDLAAHSVEWVECISRRYRDVDVHELPPNGQGLATLIALGVLQYRGIIDYPLDSADSIHLQLEAMKIGFAEAHRHVADPTTMQVRSDALLDDAFLRRRADEIHMNRAGHYESKVESDSGTVYLSCADRSGMMVSFIQSNYEGFGSGIVVPGTGISLQNRGACFSTDPAHPNVVAPGKRPFHTIIPAMASRHGNAILSFGVMGGHMQPQGHVQMILRIFDHQQNPQTAADAPRWHVNKNFEIALEKGLPAEVRAELTQRGHRWIADSDVSVGLFGGAQLIHRLDDGYCAGSDSRKDGQAVGY